MPFGPADGAAAARLVAGALVAWLWVRGTLRGSTPAWGRAALGVVAGLLATMPWTGGPAGGGFSVVDALWSSRGGLLATSPAVYVGVLGWIALWRVDRAIASAGLALLAATAVLVSSRAAWWTGAWPSPAAFLALTPYCVCGVAALVDASARFVARRPTLAVGALASLLVLWNVTLMKMANDGQYQLGEPASFGDVGAAQARALHGWIGHPASAPANVAFALANGVRPGDYDVLAPNRLLAGATRPAASTSAPTTGRSSARAGTWWSRTAARPSGGRPGRRSSTCRWTTPPTSSCRSMHGPTSRRRRRRSS